MSKLFRRCHVKPKYPNNSRKFPPPKNSLLSYPRKSTYPKYSPARPHPPSSAKSSHTQAVHTPPSPPVPPLSLQAHSCTTSKSSQGNSGSLSLDTLSWNAAQLLRPVSGLTSVVLLPKLVLRLHNLFESSRGTFVGMCGFVLFVSKMDYGKFVEGKGEEGADL